MPWPDADVIHLHWLSEIAGRGREPLRKVLGSYLGLPPARVVIEQSGPSTKPVLADGAGLRFNWSHSRDLALVAVAVGSELGVDIEYQDRKLDAVLLAERFFAAEETALLRAMAPAEARRAFLRIWTGKEAVLKAAGCGIGGGLDRVIVLPDEAAGLRLVRSALAQMPEAPMQLRALPVPREDVLASLAWSGRARRLRHFRHLEPIATSELLHPTAQA